ncbi:DNA damage-binding protein 1 [Kappamyces sp. JEL0680]|nr:DNA damage-binding protein 1 [Kappamyces sp. JEL0680]
MSTVPHDSSDAVEGLYIVSALASESVLYSCTAHFTHSLDLNLILVKGGGKLEIYLISDDKEKTLSLVMEAPLQGKIIACDKIRLRGRSRKSNSIHTDGMGNVFDLGAKASSLVVLKSNSLALMAPEKETMGLSPPPIIGLYQSHGLFKIIPTLAGGGATSFGDAYNIRLSALDLLDWCWLSTKNNEPTIAVLHQDVREIKHVSVYRIDLKKKVAVPSFTQKVDDGALFLIPIAMGGFLVVSEVSLSYTQHEAPSLSCTTSFKPKIINTYCMIDDYRYLLGDSGGNVYIAAIVSSPTQNKLYCSLLGQTCQSSSMSYLNDGLVFVGSCAGDSQLIQLLSDEECARDGMGAEQNIRVLQSYSSLGPVSDFCVVEREGQGQIVACCGAYKDSSLRIIRNGIGIQELGRLDEGLCNCLLSVWSLKKSANSSADELLLLSFVSETRVVAKTKNTFQELQGAGFRLDDSTLFASNCLEGHVVQVTATQIAVLESAQWTVSTSWTMPQGDYITHASLSTPGRLVIAVGTRLASLALSHGAIRMEKETDLGRQISCLYCNPTHAAAGLWTDSSIHLYALPSLQHAMSQPLATSSLPRSILLTVLEGTEYLLIAMGNGDLYMFQVAYNGTTIVPNDMKKTSLGTQPIDLRTFTSQGVNYVFASSDRPTIIYSRSGKLMFSSVNLKNVVAIAPFCDEAECDSLVIATNDSLQIGLVETVQKLHVKKIPVGETCRRIVEWDAYFGVIVSSTFTDDTGALVEKSSVCLFDGMTFECIDRFELQDFELASSLHSCLLANGETKYLVAGTGLAYPDESEPTTGRILVFAVEHRRLRLVSEFAITGSAYSLVSLHGKLFAGIIVLEWDTATNSFTLECTHQGHVLCLVLATRGDLVIVGDLMKSITCLFYDPVNKELSLHAKDYDTHWMTAVESLSSNVFIGADSSSNIFTLKKDPNNKNLVIEARYFLGDMINRFRAGSLVMKAGDTPLVAKPRLLYCTVAGSIGVVATLDRATFELLEKLEGEMKKLDSVGFLSPEM